MMIAAVIRVCELALTVDRAAEFAAPDHERFVEHPALLKIAHERSGGLIDGLALHREIARQVVVLIPAAMVELDESHAALDQSPRQQAVATRSCRACATPGRTSRTRSRALREIDQLRHRGLHAVRHFVLRDARLDLRIAIRLVLHLVDRATPSSICRRVAASMPGGFERYSTGSAPARNFTP